MRGRSILWVLAAVLVSAAVSRQGFASEDGPGISADAALVRLQEGNARFVGGKSEHPHTDAARLGETARNGQKPIATIVACSDSRVPVERILDQGFGDVFIIRVAGNVCNTDEIGSVEYGVDHLETPVLAVMGHTSCGAVTAVATGAELHGSIPPLVANIKSAVAAAQKANPNLHGKDLVPEAIKANVWQSIDDLFKASAAVRKRVESGKLKIVGAIYDLATGKIEWLGAHPEQNRLLAYTGGGAGHGEPPAGGHSAAVPADAHASGGTGAVPAGHGAGGEGHPSEGAVAVKAESVTLIEASKLVEMDKARHRQAQAAEAAKASAATGLSLLWKVAIGFAALLALGLIGLKSGLVSNVGIAGKLYLGFGIVVLIAGTVGYLGYHSLSVVAEEDYCALNANDVETKAGQVGRRQNDFLLIGLEDKVRGEEALKEHAELIKEMHKDFTTLHECDPDGTKAGMIASIEEATKKYEQAFTQIVAKYHEVEKNTEELDKVGKTVDARVSRIVQDNERELAEMERNGTDQATLAGQSELVTRLNQCEVLALRVSQAELEFLLDKKMETVKTLQEELGLLRGDLKAVEQMITRNSKDQSKNATDLQLLAQVQGELGAYEKTLAATIEDELLVEADEIDCNEDLQSLVVNAKAFSDNVEKLAAEARTEANELAFGLIGAAIVIGGLLAFFTTQGITRPLKQMFRGLKKLSTAELKQTGEVFNRIIEGMNESVAQVAEAAAQVSAASQSLAEGASEQASSLEETSSALEQMAAMTRTNAANAKEANELSVQTSNAAEQGDQTMKSINESSDQISKIIKVIEEIAFQTNLLALNAAVEAARAGEHGKGFAVVADEVRNLAQRAGQAAKETTTLIESSVAKSREGMAAVQGIVEGVNKVKDLLDGIAKASEEQAQGVDQVNTAVAQMDKVTQQNASASEESASAAEELNAQAGATKGLVDELMLMVRGQASSASVRHATPKQPARKPADGAARIAKGKGSRTKEATHVAAAPTAKADEATATEGFMSLENDKELKQF